MLSRPLELIQPFLSDNPCTTYYFTTGSDVTRDVNAKYLLNFHIDSTCKKSMEKMDQWSSRVFIAAILSYAMLLM